MLLTNATNYSKGILSEILEFVMGQGMIPADGEVWKTRRRAIVPALHRKYITSMVDMFGDSMLHGTQVGAQPGARDAPPLGTLGSLIPSGFTEHGALPSVCRSANLSQPGNNFGCPRSRTSGCTTLKLCCRLSSRSVKSLQPVHAALHREVAMLLSLTAQ